MSTTRSLPAAEAVSKVSSEPTAGCDTVAPGISVILPVYNAAPHLEMTLESLRRQEWHALELIAVDDGSNDGSARILEREQEAWQDGSRRMVVLREPHSGAAAARNAGVAQATGPIVLFVDADDLLHPELARRLAGRLEDEAIDLAFPRYRHIDETGAPLNVISPAAPARCTIADLMVESPIHSATGVMVRKSALDRAGTFDTTMRGCIDLDLFVRVAALRPGNVAALNWIGVEYRRRRGQITSDWRRMETHWLRVADKLAAAGHGLPGSAFRRGRSRNRLYCAATAYQAGAEAEARELVWRTIRDDPAVAVTTAEGRVRTLAAVASLLPRPVHKRIRDAFNGRPGPREIG